MTVQLPGDPKSYELAYEQARAGIQHQRGVLDALHGRAAALLGAASIAASFLGGIALEDTQIGFLGILAVLVFAGVAGLALLTLAPYRDWKFILSAEILIDGWVEGDPPASPAELHRQLGLLMLANQEHNQRRLDWMWTRYGWGLKALAAMIVFWLIELASVLPPLAM